MSDRYVTVVYKLPEDSKVESLLAHPHVHAMASRNALSEPLCDATKPVEPALARLTRERDHLQQIADSQLATIKALIYGCEKYGLTETTPVVRHMDAMSEELQRMQVNFDSRLRDARLGEVALKFVDRAGDVHPGIDDADTICSEFAKAMLNAFEASVPDRNSMVHASLFDFAHRMCRPTPEDANLTVEDYRKMAYEVTHGFSPRELGAVEYLG